MLAALFSTACYTFQPMASTPPVGSDVRVTVSDAQALELTQQTGQLSRTVDGRLVGASDDSVFVSVVTLRLPSEISGSRQLRQSVGIPRTGVEALATRELSVLRSGVIAALGSGLVAVVVRQVVVGGSNEEEADDGQTIGTLIPIIRIPVGR
ncbi:MAG: hypothetical protein OXU74_07410 [Gemmatimonadota bacterium]|nr:hypothetical protein [Gemmatimonadota bacterium]